MKAKLSNFLTKNKQVISKLVNDLSTEYKYVSILGEDLVGTSYSVSQKTTSVGDTKWASRGFVLRVFNGVNYSEYSFNNLNDVELIKSRIKEIAIEDIQILQSQGIDLIDFPLIEEAALSKEYYTEYLIDPTSVSSEEKLKRMTELKDFGFNQDKNFIDFRVNYEEVLISKMFISTQKDLSQAIQYTNLTLVGIGNKNTGVKYDFEGISGLKGYEIMDEAKEAIIRVSDSVKSLYDSKRVIPGEYDVICDPSVSGLIAHEAFGHGVEMDMFVKNRAQGKEFIDKYVASVHCNMKDGALSAQEVGTYLFDDEGTLGTSTQVIKDGVLKAGISDLLSALKLSSVPTGNGRRESYERKAYARMTNTFFEEGTDTVEDMVASIKKGYMLEGYFSGMEDPKNWGIQCMLAKGREIIDGKFTGNVVSPILMTGYVPDLLKSISMVSSDLQLSGTGACGKGHKEWVKTSTGGTYIKAVGRLG